jgi:hypothetical protein
MNKVLFVFIAVLSMTVTLLGQNARLELNGNFNIYAPYDSGGEEYQMFSYGLKAEKLFSNKFGWHTGFSIGSLNDVAVDIYEDTQFGSSTFFSLEPGISFHTGQNMNGFVVDLTIRSGLQSNKADFGGQEIKDNYFFIGPELGFGFNTILSGNWCIGGKFGGGALASEFAYIHLFGGISVSRRF